MKHPSDGDLLLFHYEGGRRTAGHVEACSYCRGRVDELTALLAAVEKAPVPERGEDYGRRVWSRIAARLPERPVPAWRRFFEVRSLAIAGAVASLLLIGFLAGRRVGPQGTSAALSKDVRERILLVNLGDHLDRSQAVLIELVNAPETKEGVDISREQARAADLVAANRLYRVSAARAGESNVAGVLDELERVLLEIAHGPARVSPADLKQIQERIQAEGVLFRVRVIGSTVRDREESRRPSEQIRERKSI